MDQIEFGVFCGKKKKNQILEKIMNVQAFSREGIVDVDNNLKNKY